MNLQESIRRILREESSIQIKLKNMINKLGIKMASTAVGGVKNVAKILELDLDDVDTQLMLVKNFIYHTKVDQIDVSFIEVRSSGRGGKVITINLKTDDTASNVTSWYVHEICNYLNNKLFPFKVKPAWHPVFELSGCKIFLDAKIVDEEEDEEENDENLMESNKKGTLGFWDTVLPNELKRRSQNLDDLIDKIKDETTELCGYKTPLEYFTIIVSELMWELKTDIHGDLYKLKRSDVTQYVFDFKYRELEDYYLKNCKDGDDDLK